MGSDVILVIVVCTALAFDFTNGFHDTANVVATSISTRAVSPRLAVLVASLLNFAGAFISLAVAATWYFGLPSSSSQALIGGVVGATIAADGTSAVQGDGLLSKVVVPALVAP